MVPQSSDIEAAALELDPHRRAQLALRLIESLDRDEHLSQDEVEQLWLEEAEERLRLMESGESESIPAEQVFEDARRSLKS
jgi:hypothetical protein